MIHVSSLQIELINTQVFLGDGIKFIINKELEFSYNFDIEQHYNLFLNTLYDVFYNHKKNISCIFKYEVFFLKIDFQKDFIIFTEEEILKDKTMTNIFSKLIIENNEIAKREFKRFYSYLSSIDIEERKELEKKTNNAFILNLSEQLLNNNTIKFFLENEFIDAKNDEEEEDGDDEEYVLPKKKAAAPKTSPLKKVNKKNEEKIQLFTTILDDLIQKNKDNDIFSQLSKNIYKMKKNKYSFSLYELINTYIFETLKSLNDVSYVTQQIMNYCNNSSDKKIKEMKDTYFDIYKKIVKDIVDKMDIEDSNEI